MAKRQLMTSVHREGQRYVDEPIVQTLNPRPELVSPLAKAVAHGLGGQVPLAVSEVIGHERVQLRWLTSDGKGGLKPLKGR